MQAIVAVDAVDVVCGELPVPAYPTDEEVRLAVRAVVVHGPELWPAGPLCRNCRVPYRCRLHRWGRRVLAVRGLTGHEIDELVERGDPAAPVPDSTAVRIGTGEVAAC